MIAYKWGIEFFDSKYDRYGGHWQAISRLTRLDYLSVSISNRFFCKVKYWNEYYDGEHHTLAFWWFRINWGGPPYSEGY